MRAIYKRELKAYFHSFIGTLFIGATLFLLGIYFAVYNLFMGYSYIGYALSSVVFLFLISIPILTMRILAEERKQKTDQLILTAPVSVSGIVVGKFLALATIFAIPIGIISIYPLVLSIFGEVVFGETYLAIIGFLLYGLACIAIGIFISSITESQVIAAVITFGILFLGYVMSGLTNMISTTGNLLTKVLDCFDMVRPFDELLNGSLHITSIVYYLSIIAIFLIFTVQSIQKRRYQVSARNISMSAYSSLVIVISTVIAVFLNVFANKLPTKCTVFDLTNDKIYSITDDSKKLVKAIEEEINIYVLVNEKQADETLDATLQNYVSLNSNIQVSYVDPAVNPKFFTQYTDASVTENSLVIESSNRSKVIDYSSIYRTEFDYTTYSSVVTGYDGEGQITSAISYVVSDSMPKVYILEGHEELAFDNTFQDSLEKANVEYETINLMNYQEIPSDAESVIVNAPTEDLSSDDAEKVLDYMEKGGDVLLISTYTGKELSNFNRLLDYYGVQVSKGLVIEDNANYYYQDPFYLLPEVAYDMVTGNVYGNGSYVFVPYAQGLTYEEKDDTQVTALLSASEDSYVREDIEGSTSYTKQEGDVEGPFDVGLKCEKTTEEDVSVGIIFSSENIFTQGADSMVAGNNQKLFNGVISSFIGDEEASGISVPVKRYEISYLTISQSNIIWMALMTVIVIPFSFLIIGFFVWINRRNR